MRPTNLKRSYFKWIAVFVFAAIMTNALADEELAGKIVNVPLRRMTPSTATHYKSPQMVSRMYRDDPLGGGMTVLGTYYIEVEANGHRLRLQLVRISSPLIQNRVIS